MSIFFILTTTISNEMMMLCYAMLTIVLPVHEDTQQFSTRTIPFYPVTDQLLYCFTAKIIIPAISTEHFHVDF